MNKNGLSVSSLSPAGFKNLSAAATAAFQQKKLYLSVLWGHEGSSSSLGKEDTEWESEEGALFSFKIESRKEEYVTFLCLEQRELALPTY